MLHQITDWISWLTEILQFFQSSNLHWETHFLYHTGSSESTFIFCLLIKSWGQCSCGKELQQLLLWLLWRRSNPLFLRHVRLGHGNHARIVNRIAGFFAETREGALQQLLLFASSVICSYTCRLQVELGSLVTSMSPDSNGRQHTFHELVGSFPCLCGYFEVRYGFGQCKSLAFLFGYLPLFYRNIRTVGNHSSRDQPTG